MIDGLEADVVTLALAYDIDAIAQSGLIDGWLAEAAAAEQLAVHLDHRLPGPEGEPERDQGLGRPGEAGDASHHAEPEDVRRRAMELPRGLGLRAAPAGRHARRKARQFVGELFKKVPVLDSGARGSTMTFVRRQIGDVLLAWENEAHLALAESPGQLEIVVPSVSILAEPPVAVVDKVVDRRGTRAIAEAYLQYLYSPEGQEIAAKRHYRPRDEKVAARFAGTFANGEALHDRRGLRRLAEGAEDALRRRRRLRSDLQTRGTMSRASSRRVLPGFGLTMGITVFYLSLIVLIPLATLPAKTLTMSWAAFRDTITDPRVVASYQLERRRIARGGGGERGLRLCRRVGARRGIRFRAAASLTR